MASTWSYKNQSSSYRGKFRWIFDQGKGNLVSVGGEIEVSECELVNRVKMTEKWGKIQGKYD